MQVTLFAANGSTVRPGWPRMSDCSGTFVADGIPAGDHVLEVVAIGELQGDPEAVLYGARTSVSVPREGSLALSLEPKVAFLDIGWTYDGDMSAACRSVTEVEVIVAAGGDAFTGTFACAAGPIRIEEPFAIQSYAIQVSARSALGFALYVADARRTLQVGLNEYTAVLTPRGGQVLIDFEFTIGTDFRSRMCDHASVGAGDIDATIHFLDGGRPTNETFRCDEIRPYAFSQTRFSKGVMLELELVADAAERFLARRRFAMPDGDFDTGLLEMKAVGTGTVSIEVMTSSCAVMADAMEVSIRPEGEMEVVAEAIVEPPAMDARFADLPYGRYDVEVLQLYQSRLHCRARGIRTIADRENAWDPFAL